MFDNSEWNEAWETSDPLPMWAAAYLSIGERPLGPDADRFVALDITTRLNPIIQVLSMGFLTGEFDPDEANAVRERVGHYEWSLVYRADVRRFLKKRGIPCEFLKMRKSTYQGYRQSDAPLVERMRGMIESGEAKSVPDAALAFVNEAKGSNNVASKQKRLERAFSIKYSDFQRSAL